MPDEEAPQQQHEPFVDVLDGAARLKIIGEMLGTHARDINISDISKQSGVARSTIYEHIDALVELGIIQETRQVGGSQMYQINAASPVVEGVKILNVKAAECVNG